MAKFSLDQFIGKHDRLEVEKADLEVGKHVFVLRTHQKSGGKENKILLAASNDDERDKWIQCIKAFSAYYLDEVSRFLLQFINILRLNLLLLP